jgi:FlaA1/EpsC-like NDP-sugar epimerase
VSRGDFNGSFWTFYPLYFDGWYGFGGNFAWMGLHLWYLEMLLVFSILVLPIFLFLNRSKIENIIHRYFSNKRPVIIFTVSVLTIAMVEMLVNQYPDSIGIRDLGGWSFFTYFTIFILGYVYFGICLF